VCLCMCRPEPAFPGADTFKGVQMHSHGYRDWRVRMCVYVACVCMCMYVGATTGREVHGFSWA